MSPDHARYRRFAVADVPDAPLTEQFRRARPDAGLTVLDFARGPRRIRWRELAELATDAARVLRARGAAPGDRVCLLAPTSADLLVTLAGVWRLGAVPVLMPRPRRADTDSFVAEIRRRVTAAAPALLVTTEEQAALLSGRIAAPAVSLDELRRSTAGAGRPAPPVPSADAVALLQFTSGTTAASRAVPVTHAQLAGNIAAVGERAGVGPDDTMVSWLPLYHDMGVVTLGGMAAGGADVVLMATEDFLRQPARWMGAVSEYRGTFTAAPDFAYGLAARVQALRPAALDLSSLRVAANGAEAIDAEALSRTGKVLGDAGLPPHALCPMYGLAEATLGVTGSAGDEPVRVLGPGDGPAAPGAAEAGHPRPERRLVSCGPPLPGTEVRIEAAGTADGLGLREDGLPEDAAGDGPVRVLPDGAVGEVMVRGPGVTPGYWTAGGGTDPGGTRGDGWLATGDLGFLDGGELFVCGRIKDMVIAGGRNLYPEDYELVAESVPGVRAGNVIAFSVPGEERMVVVAEGRDDDVAALGRRVLDTLREAVEHAPHEVVVIAPDSLPKTSSGKRRRLAARARYASGALDVLHTAR
ncbi:AMP-binding protein [Streptomyces sp. JJ36]|uniref:AMP-binding protein n=1 Tax=Streptomyces sp. JJ36 TaxID=2736645 RepID=UPI001F424F2B|nr:AMP-binding protein [Streptomyces sp. JJ36]MCF6526372.1 AMP-binding protein [Streptomyces sp. JJ36]